MSFILDALKKSETERQRADAPALYEMKLAPPRRGVATWLMVLAGLLVINVVVLSVVLLHGSRDSTAPGETGNSGTPSAVAPVAASTAAPTAAAAATPGAAAPAAATVMPAAVVGNPPAGSALTDPAVSATASDPQAADSDDAPAVEPSRTVAASGAQAGAQNTAQTGTQGSTRGGVTLATGVGSGDVPTYQQVASEPGANLPELKLDLHSYATNPADRFVFLNMVNLKEGQTSPAGVRVETITPDGAILSWHGSRFFLQRQ